MQWHVKTEAIQKTPTREQNALSVARENKPVATDARNGSMKDKIKNLAESAKKLASSAVVLVGDLNGDGKVDEQDARIAAKFVKKTGSAIGDEVGKLVQTAARSEMVKDAAAGAAIGALIAVPIPLVGPAFGGAVGAGIGLYNNMKKRL